MDFLSAESDQRTFNKTSTRLLSGWVLLLAPSKIGPSAEPGEFLNDGLSGFAATAGGEAVEVAGKSSCTSFVTGCVTQFVFITSTVWKFVKFNVCQLVR